jgi:hypothetical protein
MHDLIISMEQSLSQQANSRSVVKKSTALYGTRRFFYRGHRSLPLTTMSDEPSPQLPVIRIQHLYLFSIYLTAVFHLLSDLQCGPFPSIFLNKICVPFS